MSVADLIQLCKQKNKTIASCESLTAGLFTSTIASYPGASSILKGGIVTYWTEVKENLVHVDPSIVLEYGVISQQCADAMAIQIRDLLNVDYGISFTGNAGPEVMENKSVGCVYCSIATNKECKSFHFQYKDLGRNKIRERVVQDMIENLLQIVMQEEKKVWQRQKIVY